MSKKLVCDNILFKCKMKRLLVQLESEREGGRLGSIGPAVFQDIGEFLDNLRETEPPAQCVFSFPEKNKTVIAIGDIHGDFMALLSALYLASVINEQGFWIGKKTFVVQMGDIFDRGGRGVTENTSHNQREEIDILQYLHALHAQAQLSGGAVISLVGNHEAEQFTAGSMYPARQASKYETDFMVQGWGGLAAKRRLFKPGSALARYFSRHKPLLLQINDFIFCHGGLVPSMLQPGDSVHSLNRIWNEYLSGQRADVPANIAQVYWNRDLSLPAAGSASSNSACVALVNDLFDRLQIPRDSGGIVVAHTVQKNIPLYCEGKVWRVDVALSEAFGRRSSPIEILRVRFGASDWAGSTVVQIVKGLQDKSHARVEIHNFVRGNLTWIERIATNQ